MVYQSRGAMLTNSQRTSESGEATVLEPQADLLLGIGLVFTLAAASLRPAPSGCPRRMTAICAKRTFVNRTPFVRFGANPSNRLMPLGVIFQEVVDSV
jgi:hypothetical protein